MLSKELQSFKQDMRKDLGEFKNNVKKTMKQDLAEFKDNVLKELQNQNASIAEAQSRIADLESACLELKDTLLTVAKQNSDMQDKLLDLESRSRRNNLRIYGIPEGKEGSSVTEFVGAFSKVSSHYQTAWISRSNERTGCCLKNHLLLHFRGQLL